MSDDLKYLSQLIDMINKDGNEHSRKRLWSLIGLLAKKEIGNMSEIEAPILLSEVHELNMEQYIKIQAKHFYDEFPCVEIKEQLIADFIEMEHCRRRDDFYRFCVAVYQQIENITNYLFRVHEYWSKTGLQIKKELPALLAPQKDKWSFSLGSQLIYTPKGNIIDINAVNALLEKDPAKLHFSEKYRITLFFGYFKDENINFMLWKTVYDLGDKLYAARNKVHRGTIDSEKQAEKLRTIEKNKYKYYLLFSGFLADFIQRISFKYSRIKVGEADKVSSNHTI